MTCLSSICDNNFSFVIPIYTLYGMFQKQCPKFLVIIFVLFGSKNYANHIIGGVMSYECIGNNDFRITMKMYRDCYCYRNPIPCAPFDNPAVIGIYNCGNMIDCIDLNQLSVIPNGVLNINFSDTVRIDNPEFDCLIPPDVCVSEATYVFDLSDYGIQLPNNGEPYVISFQRCCRNRGINNLVQPSDAQGVTFSTTITPEAMTMCNTSPQFTTFPPSIICNDVPFEYDHSAIDMDGDSLVYYFCAPYAGGGQILTTPEVLTCEGAIPTPGCPPPFEEVQYQSPFSGASPLPGNFTIDPQTGFLRGTPTMEGRFVVGVCVDEYRNGQRLTTTRRDFQFNIAQCEPEVDSKIASDSIVAGIEFVITSCGEYEVQFTNTSEKREFIDDWLWQFDINGRLLELTSWDAVVQFPDTGVYRGTLVLNPGANLCSDTAIITVAIRPRMEAIFEPKFDNCLAFPIQFKNQSFSEQGEITRYLWDFGDGNTSTEFEPTHIYEKPGRYTVRLTVQDGNGCNKQTEQIVEYTPVPLSLIVDPIPSGECSPVSVWFRNLSRPIDTSYSIFWDFGDGNTSTEVSPVHIYEDEGSYTVSLRVESSENCVTEEEFVNMTFVKPSPKADFDYSPTNPTLNNPTVQFTDQSQDATSWLWIFANQGSSSLQNPAHTFSDTGTYRILQIATHPNGCRDTSFADIEVRPDLSYHLPNAFTPNGDGINDVYLGVGNLYGARNFEMTIWNRYGDKLFESNNPDVGWNGRVNNVGELVQPGVYLCRVRYLDDKSNKVELKSFATLIQ